MKTFITALLATAVTAVSSIDSKYVKYLVEHGKSIKTAEDFQDRKSLFLETDKLIESHNTTNSSFTLGHNKFSDLREDEKAKYRGRLPFRLVKPDIETKKFDTSNLPASFDWRELGGVNAIKD